MENNSRSCNFFFFGIHEPTDTIYSNGTSIKSAIPLRGGTEAGGEGVREGGRSVGNEGVDKWSV